MQQESDYNSLPCCSFCLPCQFCLPFTLVPELEPNSFLDSSLWSNIHLSCWSRLCCVLSSPKVRPNAWRWARMGGANLKAHSSLPSALLSCIYLSALAQVLQSSGSGVMSDYGYSSRAGRSIQERRNKQASKSIIPQRPEQNAATIAALTVWQNMTLASSKIRLPVCDWLYFSACKFTWNVMIDLLCLWAVFDQSLACNVWASIITAC